MGFPCVGSLKGRYIDSTGHGGPGFYQDSRHREAKEEAASARPDWSRDSLHVSILP